MRNHGYFVASEHFFQPVQLRFLSQFSLKNIAGHGILMNDVDESMKPS
jgi:hypothetical protein